MLSFPIYFPLQQPAFRLALYMHIHQNIRHIVCMSYCRAHHHWAPGAPFTEALSSLLHLSGLLMVPERQPENDFILSVVSLLQSYQLVLALYLTGWHRPSRVWKILWLLRNYSKWSKALNNTHNYNPCSFKTYTSCCVLLFSSLTLIFFHYQMPGTRN